MEAAQRTLGALHAAGVRIALDDFGTGYSSLYHLRNFKIDKLKIDRSFIDCMERDPEAASLVRALLGFGRGTGTDGHRRGRRKARAGEGPDRAGMPAGAGFSLQQGRVSQRRARPAHQGRPDREPSQRGGVVTVGRAPVTWQAPDMRDKRRRVEGSALAEPTMSSKSPSLTAFRRIVVKVGSSLLVDAEAGRVKEDWLASLAEDIASLHQDKRDVLVVSSGAIALGRAVLKLPEGPAQARGQPGRGRGRTDRAGAHLGGGAVAPRHHRRPGAGDAAGHRGAPALPQCALDHRAAAGMARGAGDQRERHRRHHRNPLRRQ